MTTRYTLLPLCFLAGLTTRACGPDPNDPDDDDDSDSPFSCDIDNGEETVGLKLCQDGAFEGYTLFAPIGSTTTYLIDMYGREVHSWASDYRPGQSAYLLDDGSLLRTINTGQNGVFDSGGKGGGFQVLNWDGAVVWEYHYDSTEHCQHHDVRMLPSGNVLVIAWEYKSETEALDAGRNPNKLTDGELWSDSIVEVAKSGSNDGTVVWEWHAWDHLVQAYSQSKANYGVVADHPELIDLNYTEGPGQADWLHTNSVDYNAQYNQIILSVHGFSEVWIIDHSTTTDEAASHAGGDQGHGGDLLYRWGNPSAYGAGSEADQVFYTQHNAHWIEDGLPGDGDILVFNNGSNRPDGNYSSIDQFKAPISVSGGYELEASEAYGPSDLDWTYRSDPSSDFYSTNISGADRMKNGNTVICDGAHGTIFEVTQDGDTVWSYINPVTDSGVLNQGDSIPLAPNGQSKNQVFRAYRYPPEYSGLSGRDLTPRGYLEGSSE